MTSTPGLTSRFDAILLAGGRSSRLGGIDKTALRHHGVTLLDAAATAVSGAHRTVLVGPQAATDVATDVTVARENPPFSGPAAALLTGVAALADGDADEGAEDDGAGLVVVLACDLLAPAAALGQLTAAMTALDYRDGAIAVDDDGRRQPLLAVYRLSALRRLLETARDAEGVSLRRLLEPLALAEVHVASAVLADVDTAEAAARHGIALPRRVIEPSAGASLR
jgi:molybdopterin-guanine dinucleotide biosynthesis protein A